jgi:hypothetical protein
LACRPGHVWRGIRSPLTAERHAGGLVDTDAVDPTVQVALATGLLTAATALTASWLTGRSTIRAARMQAEFAAANHRSDRSREMRRAAYVDYITYVAQVRWRTRDLVRRAASGDATALAEFRSNRNDVGHELARRRYVVHLEGPASMQQAVDEVQEAINRLADELDVALGLTDPAQIRAMVEDSRTAIRHRTETLIDCARQALA